MPVLLRYLTSFNTFINDIRHPLSGSLMAPMSMALLIPVRLFSWRFHHNRLPNMVLCLLLHFTMMVLIVSRSSTSKMSNIVPSWFLYPVGLIVVHWQAHSLATPYFQKRLQQPVLVFISSCSCGAIYRLVFEGNLPRRARPTLAIMAAPGKLVFSRVLGQL
ncbi:hypothetical protein OK016_23645 [Vibrio chagasii]|nr:hypothetical protein [Vibrio chagasii]